MSAQRSGSLDWKDLRERISRAEIGLRDSQTLSPERAQRILEERAEFLARPVSRPRSGQEANSAVEFVSAQQRFILPLAHLSGAGTLKARVPLPGAIPFLQGLASWRGETVAVFDLAAWFGLKVARSEPAHLQLVVGRSQPEFGLEVDTLERLVSADTENLLEPTMNLPGDQRKCLSGVTRDGALVLNAAQLLDAMVATLNTGGRYDSAPTHASQ